MLPITTMVSDFELLDAHYYLDTTRIWANELQDEIINTVHKLTSVTKIAQDANRKLHTLQLYDKNIRECERKILYWEIINNIYFTQLRLVEVYSKDIAYYRDRIVLLTLDEK